jgi:hypothetical protein
MERTSLAESPASGYLYISSKLTRDSGVSESSTRRSDEGTFYESLSISLDEVRLNTVLSTPLADI